MSNNIWVAGVPFPIEAKCVRWDEKGGFNAHIPACVPYPRPSQPCKSGGVVPWSAEAKNLHPNRFANRPRMRGREHDLAAAQAVIKKFVLHLDGCPNAASCFNTLHNERGLSCHFVLDNNGDLYQTLDLVYMGYHAAGANSDSIGIEMSNRGDAKKFPGFYKTKRDQATCNIHGHTYLAWEFTEAQYETMRALAKALTRALPNLPLEYPQESPGRQSWKVFDAWKSYEGYLGHYHTTTRKWDPGPFDFKKFLESIRGKQSFPIAVKKDTAEVPEDNEERSALIKKLYYLNEEGTEGGYFPVGPWGETKVWHGGVHIKAEQRAPVYAPFAGRLMVARMKPGTTATGSINFVLLRYDMSIGTVPVRFWVLYNHLMYEGGEGEGAPKWLTSDAAKKQAADGKSTFLIDEPIEAGEIVGHVGLAGTDTKKPQIHFEVFTAEEVGNQIEAGKWQVRDGTSGGRYCDLAEINDLIDKNPKDGKLSKREMLTFYQRPSGDRDWTHWLVVQSYSEWTAEPDWNEALRGVPDYQGQTQQQVDRVVSDQINPTLWWTPTVAKHAKMPTDGIVYHYHPITFLNFITEKLLEAKLLGDNGVGAFDAKDAVITTDTGVTDDNEDVSGDSFVDAAELSGNEERPTPTFQDLANGFPE